MPSANQTDENLEPRTSSLAGYGSCQIAYGRAGHAGLAVGVPTHSPRSGPRSTSAVLLAVMEALLLVAASRLSLAGLFAGSGRPWFDIAISTSLYGSVLLRITPLAGFGHLGVLAWYQSIAFYLLSWILTIADSHAELATTVTSSCLLSVALLSPRPFDGVSKTIDSTGESRSLFDILSFAWISRMLVQGWRRGTLKSQDVPALSAVDSAALNTTLYKLKRGNSFLRGLLGYFGPDLLNQAVLACVHGIFTFIPTLLLGLILKYVEGTEEATAELARHYVMLLFFTSAVASVAESQAVWIGQKIGLRIKSGSKDSSSPAASGTIMNLFTTDITMIADSGANMHQVWASVPIQILTAIILLYHSLGYSAFAGVALMAAMVPVNSRIAQRFGAIQLQVMAATDARIQVTSEVLRSIRVIKLISWGPFFKERIGDKRAAELDILRSRYVLWSTAATIWYGMPLLIAFLSFFVYAVIQGKPLTPSLAFTSLSLFNLLKAPLDDFVGMLARVRGSLVSLRRVERFLAEGETKKYQESLTGPSADNSAAKAIDGFVLHDIDVDFRLRKLNVVIGATGSGKSSLLLALLGEMPFVDGHVRMPAAVVSESLLTEKAAELVEGVAFCAQEAWLTNDTVRNNILFHRPFDHNRYTAVLEACSLEPDLKILNRGDLTSVGDGGVSLSGGQKQRVALARAVYSNARHLLLDDCLSSIDSHTASWILRRCIKGPLMKDRTCILVTHSVHLVVPGADFVVKLDEGAVAAAGSPQDIMAAGHLPELANLPDIDADAKHAEDQRPSEKNTPSGTESGLLDVRDSSAQGRSVDSEEIKPGGTMSRRTTLEYLSSMGGLRYWIGLIFFFVAQQFGSILTVVLEPAAHSAASDASYYFGVYTFLLIAYLAIGFLRLFTLSIGSLRASACIHETLMQSVIHATLKFFDNESFGKIISVFSGDMQTMDQDLAVLAIATLHFVGVLAGMIILLVVITPAFILPGIVICAVYYLIAVIYITGSRDLKDMESNRRSPLLQQLGETLSGIVTIRAYSAEDYYSETSPGLVENSNQSSYFLAAAERWLVLRLSLAGAFVSLSVGIFAITGIKKLSAGTIGFSMSYAIVFSEQVLWLIRYYTANAKNMVALQRVQSYVGLTQEAKEATGGKRPTGWPFSGVVQSKDVSARYAPNLDYVLPGLSFTIEPLQRVGIIGRTRAGKSSLVLTLLRGLEAESGQILIGLNTREVDLQELRYRLAYVPQDPTLFAGTLRLNLDALNEHADEEVLGALRDVGLLDSSSELGEDHGPASANDHSKFGDLSFDLADAGRNISQGQRQLNCIARAILKGSKIVILDEATASIDHDSDVRIQASVRKPDATVITIAHRLRTVIDYGQIIGLDAGRAKECGHSWQLLQKQDGIFRGICEAAADREELAALAKAAREAKSTL
ncbi:P-loop containing nucleoside triphosphate hydrolase protein [Xylariaceae sp. FL0662B]|nr:P-loop containing nucleoside triphosphate hydrolase protein [Xylariaceae sp. FL0662B]